MNQGAPTVTSIAPNTGPTAGGTSVTITGTNFTGATAVTIGGVAATGITVVNATTITATTPAGTAGAQNVVVTTPYGTGTGTGLFTYVAAPTVTSISPNTGPTAGGTSVTITGTNFTGATAVTIGGVAATGITVVNATTITATTPAGTAGARSVLVTTPYGTNAANTLFTYDALTAPTATTNAATLLTATGATLNGTVSSNGASTTVTFEYGLTTGYGSTATAAQSPLAAGASGTAVSAAVSGLTCNTLYHFRVVAVNSVGTTNGLDGTFTTTACAPTATTNAATSVAATTATMNGTVASNGASTTVTFEYGLTTGYGSIATAAQSPVAAVPGSANSTAVSAAVTGLTCNTTYHFRVVAVNSVGTANGLDGTFITTACAPTATTNAASGVTPWAATLNGTVSSNGADTTVSFEYGLTTAYGSTATATQSPLGAGAVNTAVSAAVAGLNCNTTFHYRVVATNSAGTTNGLDGTFITGACGAPYPATACAATRFGNDLGCTANDVSISSIALAPTTTRTSCVSGTPVILDLDLTVNFASPDRWDVGIFIANDGKLPTLLPANGGASICSVDILPTTPPFLDLDGVPQGTLDTCGDGNGSIDDSALPGGTVPLGDGVKRMTGVTLPCYASAASGGQLFVPFVVSWDNQKSPTGSLCTSNLYPVPNTTSKCNAPASSVSVAVVVLPVITKTNGGTEINPGANTTYTVVINNNSGGTLQASFFKDPAVANLTVNSLSCAAAGGAICPIVNNTVADMQGATGIPIPSANLPNNSSLTFTINATLSGAAIPGNHLVNTASVSIGSNSNPATDDDLIVVAPSATKSFSPGTITENNTSVLTITLINPTASAVTNVSFTDTYPAGLVNTASASGATTCGGTVTAANGGNSAALSGGTIPASGSCTVTVNVTSATAGGYTNSTGTMTHAGGTIPAASGALTVNAAGGSFVFTNAACQHGIAFGVPGQCSQVVWPAQTAGVDATAVYITVVNASNVPTRLHASQARTRNMEFGLSCYDPTANAGVQATFAGATLPLCEASGATPTTWSSPVTTVTFPGGSPSSSVSYTFNYADVGSVELWMRNNATPAETGNGGAFVVKPAGFVLSNIKCTTVDAANCGAGALAMPTPGDNPGAANAAGVTFMRAGHPFSATVTATASGGAPTPNYGKETTPESVKLTSALAVGLGLTNNPAIGGTFGAFTNGVATGTAFTWNEVGIITLTPSVADANYLGAGDVIGTTSGNVGRFYPHHFDLTLGSITAADASGFSYMGEPFGVSFTLTAKNASGNPTQNYATANGFAKLDPAAASWLPAGLGTNSSFGLGAKQGTADLSSRLAVSGTPSGTWGLGEATITANLIFSRPASTTADATWGPYETLDIGVAPQDADGVQLLPGALDLDADSSGTPERMKMSNTTRLRFGRLRLVPGQGSGFNEYVLPVEAQYWNSAAWITNRDDGHTTFTPGNTNVTWVPGIPAGIAPTPSSVAAVTGGFGSIRLGTPGGHGTATICLDLGTTTGCNAGTPGTLEFLGGNWSDGAFTIDPSAVVHFGRPRPDSLAPWGFIYQRENF